MLEWNGNQCAFKTKRTLQRSVLHNTQIKSNWIYLYVTQTCSNLSRWYFDRSHARTRCNCMCVYVMVSIALFITVVVVLLMQLAPTASHICVFSSSLRTADRLFRLIVVLFALLFSIRLCWFFFTSKIVALNWLKDQKINLFQMRNTINTIFLSLLILNAQREGNKFFHNLMLF